LEKKPKTVYTIIGRAYGILANDAAQHFIQRKRLNLLSLRPAAGRGLGIVSGYGPGRWWNRIVFDERNRPHLQKQAFGQAVRRGTRTFLRSDMVRERFEEREPANRQTTTERGELKNSGKERTRNFFNGAG